MRTDRDTIVRRLALTGVIISATVLSYMTLKHRAVVIGIPEAASWFYPVLYDAFILGASRMWQNQELSSGTRKLAKFATLGGIAAALAAFVAEFWPQGFAAIGFSLVIPAVLAWSLVLTSRAAADRKVQTERSEVTPETVSEPVEEPEPVAVPDVAPEPVAAKLEGSTVVLETPLLATGAGVASNPTAVTVSDIPRTVISKVDFEPADKRSWVHAQLDAGVEVTGAMIDKKFGGRNGSRTLKSVREERAQRNGQKVKT